MIKDNYFASAVEFADHPMRNAKEGLKEAYLGTIEYFLKQIDITEHIRCRIAQYRQFLAVEKNDFQQNYLYIDEIIVCKFRPWRNKYKFWLICDLALIVIDYGLLEQMANEVKKLVSKRQGKAIDELLTMLIGAHGELKRNYLIAAKSLIEQYSKNREFFAMKEKRVIITANMSAGKSTLVNAIIGLDIARTSQEACTGNISYFYNKAFDDSSIYLGTGSIADVSECQKVHDFETDAPVSIAVGFKKSQGLNGRLCIVDSPGVDFAMNREHGRIAKKCIQEESFDILLYVLDAHKIGTDAEIAYLKWLLERVPDSKVYFVLNKLDDYKASEDDIGASIEGVRNDLRRIGYKNPVVYPISAYFAFLVKKKSSGFPISEDEEDDYEFYCKKLNKPEYDLSRYSGDRESVDCDYEGMLKKSGVYYLEKLFYGGAL